MRVVTATMGKHVERAKRNGHSPQVGRKSLLRVCALSVHERSNQHLQPEATTKGEASSSTDLLSVRTPLRHLTQARTVSASDPIQPWKMAPRTGQGLRVDLPAASAHIYETVAYCFGHLDHVQIRGLNTDDTRLSLRCGGVGFMDIMQGICNCISRAICETERADGGLQRYTLNNTKDSGLTPRKVPRLLSNMTTFKPHVSRTHPR